jgi:RimJ/RimL family protein N-acetyltransferase
MEVLISAGEARPESRSRQRLPKAADAPRSRSEDGFYRRLLHLKNDRRLMLRFLEERDRQDLIDLFQQAAGEDVWFFKHDLRNRSLLNYWLNHLDDGRLLPLVAVDLDGQRLMAAATLLRGKHTAQHIGEIKLFIAKPFRNLGLGSILLDELIRLGKQEKLHWLKAEVVADQKQLVKALQRRGFQIRATLEDFFMGLNGETYDVFLMMLLTREDSSA